MATRGAEDRIGLEERVLGYLEDDLFDLGVHDDTAREVLSELGYEELEVAAQEGAEGKVGGELTQIALLMGERILVDRVLDQLVHSMEDLGVSEEFVRDSLADIDQEDLVAVAEGDREVLARVSAMIAERAAQASPSNTTASPHTPNDGTVDGFNDLLASNDSGVLPSSQAGAGMGADRHGDEDPALTDPFIITDYDEVAMLLKDGEDPNATNQWGDAPIHLAAKNGHPTVVQLLAEHGAKLGVRDKDGLTALDLAVEGQFSDVSNLIVHLMGKQKAQREAEKAAGDSETVVSGATGTTTVTAAANHSATHPNMGSTPNNRGSADHSTVDAATADRTARSSASGSAPNSPARSNHSVALSTGGRGQMALSNGGRAVNTGFGSGGLGGFQSAVTPTRSSGSANGGGGEAAWEPQPMRVSNDADRDDDYEDDAEAEEEYDDDGFDSAPAGGEVRNSTATYDRTFAEINNTTVNRTTLPRSPMEDVQGGLEAAYGQAEGALPPRMYVDEEPSFDSARNQAFKEPPPKTTISTDRIAKIVSASGGSLNRAELNLVTGDRDESGKAAGVAGMAVVAGSLDRKSAKEFKSYASPGPKQGAPSAGYEAAAALAAAAKERRAARVKSGDDGKGGVAASFPSDESEFSQWKFTMGRLSLSAGEAKLHGLDPAMLQSKAWRKTTDAVATPAELKADVKFGKLSRPVKKAKADGFYTEADRKQCTFRPRPKTQHEQRVMENAFPEFATIREKEEETRKQAEANASLMGNDQEDLRMKHMIQRLDAAERSRIKDLENARKEADYALKLDKKSCPVCGAVQSYTDIEEKRNRCQGPKCDGAKYVGKVVNHRSFLMRQDQHVVNKYRTLEQKQKEHNAELYRPFRAKKFVSERNPDQTQGGEEAKFGEGGALANADEVYRVTQGLDFDSTQPHNGTQRTEPALDRSKMAVTPLPLPAAGPGQPHLPAQYTQDTVQHHYAPANQHHLQQTRRLPPQPHVTTPAAPTPLGQQQAQQQMYGAAHEEQLEQILDTYLHQKQSVGTWAREQEARKFIAKYANEIGQGAAGAPNGKSVKGRKGGKSRLRPDEENERSKEEATREWKERRKKSGGEDAGGGAGRDKRTAQHPAPFNAGGAAPNLTMDRSARAQPKGGAGKERLSKQTKRRGGGGEGGRTERKVERGSEFGEFVDVKSETERMIEGVLDAKTVPNVNIGAADAKAERASAERAELKLSSGGGGGGGGWCDPLDEFDPLGSARAGGNLELDPLQVSPGAGMARPARRAAGEENDPLATRSPPRMAASKRGKGGSGVVTGNWDDLLM